MWQFATQLAATCGTSMKVLQLTATMRGADLAMQGHCVAGKKLRSIAVSCNAPWKCRCPFCAMESTSLWNNHITDIASALRNALAMPNIATAAA